MCKITTILFDLDGVLVEAREWHYQALNKALNYVSGYTIPYDEHLKIFDGRPTKVKLSILFKRGIIKQKDFDKIFALKQEYTLEVVAAECKPRSEKLEMMRKLSMYRKACVTNSIFKTAYEMLVRSNLNQFLEYVQGNEATRFSKPNPSSYLIAMGNMGISPDETIIVEDNERGIASAVASGAYVLKVKNCNDVIYERVINFIKELTNV